MDAIEGIVLRQACLPEAQEKAVCHPALETVVRRGAWAEARGRKRVPLAACSQHKEDAMRAPSIRHAGPPAAEAVGVRMLGQERLHERPQLVVDDELPTRGSDALGSWSRAWLRLRTFHPPTYHENRLSG